MDPLPLLFHRNHRQSLAHEGELLSGWSEVGEPEARSVEKPWKAKRLQRKHQRKHVLGAQEAQKDKE